MGRSKNRKFEICAVYDTETCNYGTGTNTRAYPILFIDNDIRNIDLFYYEPDKNDDVRFYRTENEYLARIDAYIEWGKFFKVTPIICAYNLMFDLQPLMDNLSKKFNIRANAQSSTNVYTLDLFESEDSEFPLLRFWDTFHLEMRGLKAMGETCGIKKANGDWDYTLTRTPETPLTELELFYAKRDVQVIPAYLRYLLHANEWMKQSMLGSRVLTKTSIVRQMAKHNVAPLKLSKQNGKVLTLEKAFVNQCNKQLPNNFHSYALRKGCFRGGFTFTAAATANMVVENVASLDVTSMHHTFINGRYTPLDFKAVPPSTLELAVANVLRQTREDVLRDYHRPFKYAFHAVIKFTKIRLREGTCFSKWGIALESQAKFKKEIAPGLDIGYDPKNVLQENVVKSYGYYDRYTNATFAFGKLYEADVVELHLNELELWCLSRVYEWDSHEVMFGEESINWKRPPDYVTLQSNILYEMKNAAKFINNHYKEGTPYEYDIPTSIPDGIAESLKDGSCSNQFFESWYVSTVKGMFNGIYGTQAQDVYKPSYTCINGELMVDASTCTTEKNWDEKQPKSCKVFYNYGMRIVGGSRMHLIIAMELLHDFFGDRVRVTGGDTDSMKVSCNKDVTDEELLKALEPIAEASKKAIDTCMERMRGQWPQFASKLTGIGSFDIEGAIGGDRWEHHMEAWNKARVSECGGHSHITCAGLSRPEGAYTIENFIDDLLANGNEVGEVFRNVLGYNVSVHNSISHALEGHKPKASDTFEAYVTDYLGNKTFVQAHESQALYPVGRMLGDTGKPSNIDTVMFLRSRYKRQVDTSTRYLYGPSETTATGGRKCAIQGMTEYGIGNIMEGIEHD